MLIVVAYMLVAASAHHGQAETGKTCSHWDASTPPADMLDQLDQFRASLSEADRGRLDRALPRSANGGVAQCDTGEGSRAACEVAAYRPALRATGLNTRFQLTLCAPKP